MEPPGRCVVGAPPIGIAFDGSSLWVTNNGGNSVTKLRASDGAATEINVIGCSVEEALSRIARFLDDLLLSDERQVRIIHGFGTGQLRRSIGEYLDRHPLVASHQPAPQERGGGGVTVAELKD